ncbi:hypothetical protein JX266_014336, partial [Neoarthrinium moseri]
MDDQLVGVVQVPVSCLVFRQDLASRDLDRRICQYLAPILCHDLRHEEPQHRIEGIIDGRTLSLILAELGCTLEQLNCTLHNRAFPLLSRIAIQYVHGRHRLETAKAVLGGSTVWTVELRLYQDLSHAHLSRLPSLKARAERFAHESPFRDGNIYLHLEQSRAENDRFQLAKWSHRLTSGKNRTVERLGEHGRLNQCFQRLRSMAGLWPGKVLGNYKHILALHIQPELCRFSERMYDFYMHLTGEDPACLDVDTVRCLEARAPSASEYDLDLITRAFDTGQLFKALTSPERRLETRRRLLAVGILIPSFRTLHENLKYLSTAARIVRDLILRPPGGGRGGARARRDAAGASSASLADELSACWTEPRDALVEISESVFQPLVGPLPFQLAYQMLILAALRNFPYLNHLDGPRVQCGEKIVPTEQSGARTLFYRRARLLGFSNQRIEEGSALETDPFMPICEDVPPSSVFLADKKSRWGRPHVQTFRVIQQIAFLPQMEHVPQRSLHPSVAFVFRDFFQSFMGSATLAVDWQRESVSLYQAAQDPVVQNAAANGVTGNSAQRKAWEMAQDTSRDMGQDVERASRDLHTGNHLATIPEEPAPEGDIIMQEDVHQDAEIDDVRMGGVDGGVRNPSPQPGHPGALGVQVQVLGHRVSPVPSVSMSAVSVGSSTQPWQSEGEAPDEKPLSILSTIAPTSFVPSPAQPLSVVPTPRQSWNPSTSPTPPPDKPISPGAPA